MNDLIEFLKARIDEDERIAKAAAIGPWRVDNEDYAEIIYGGVDEMTAVVAGGRWGGEASVFDETADALHIVRHDPARELREVAAKRLILSQHDHHRFADNPDEGEPKWAAQVEASKAFPDTDKPFVGCATCHWDSGYEEVYCAWWCDIVRALAAIYNDHPDYNPAWASDPFAIGDTPVNAS